MSHGGYDHHFLESPPDSLQLSNPSDTSLHLSTDESLAFTPLRLHGTFGDQFLAIAERVVRQSLRSKKGLFLEIFIPILFVIISALLWALWETDTYEELQFVNYSELGMATKTLRFMWFTCYNESGGNFINGISPCSTVFYNVTCEGDESELPVRGLCYMKELSEVGPANTWITSFERAVWRVPELDDVIMYQWLARKAGGNKTLLNVLTSGLLGSTVATAIQNSGYIYFVGGGVDGLIRYFRRRSLFFRFVYNHTFRTLNEAHDAMTGTTNNWAIVEVMSMTRDNFDVVIHLNGSSLPLLNLVRDPVYVGGYAFSRMSLYGVSGFLSIQQIVSEYYLLFVSEEVGLSLPLPMPQYFVPSGYANFTTAPILTNTGPLLPFIYVLAFLYPVSQLTKKIVLEKETRIREAMLIMGLRNAPIYMSWYAVYIFEYAVICIIIVVILRATYMVKSDPFVIFFFFYYYALTTISLSGFLATFFSKARLASLLSPLIYLIMAVPLFALTNGAGWISTMFSFFSPSAFAVISMSLLKHEINGGFRKQLKSPLDDPTVYTALVILTVDFVLYTVLMLYLDAVLPRDWGTPKHPLFFIINPVRKFWGAKEAECEMGPDGRAKDGIFEDSDGDEEGENAVLLMGLRKVYKRNGKNFLAVRNLYWALKMNEISVLLGHNGAGKSTTLSMMTGMVKPDGGDCYVHGLSVRKQLSQVRQQIGFCPQHNILWPELTCREHLEFFAKIKGLKGAELENAVQRMLKETDLLDKIDYPSASLSGGQKRKLSVGIAFVGRCPLVFLDEPTAGMDVGARRYIWELLRRMSASHTILLTTHYMDEADLLGHRIGIMSEGRLQCSGSSLFLKSRLGMGYNMSVSLFPETNVDEIDRVVLSFVGGASLGDVNGSEVSYSIPLDQIDDFSLLIDAFDESKDTYGIRGYSVSVTSLEEVFICLCGNGTQRIVTKKPENVLDDDELQLQEKHVWQRDVLATGSRLCCSQLYAMLLKRVLNGLRDRRMQFFQVVCPIVCILVAVVLNMVNVKGSTTVSLDATAYGSEISMVTTSGCEGMLGMNFSMANFVTERKNFLNALNLSWYLVDRWHANPYQQYGALFCNDINLMSLLDEQQTVVHLVNSSGLHHAAISMSSFYNAMYQTLNAGKSSNEGHMRISASTFPQTESEVVAVNTIKAILIGVIITIPFTFLPSNPVAWIVKERECKARHLQNVSGLHFYVYWGANFLFDMTLYFITMLLAIIIFVIFDRQEYIAMDRIGPTILVFVAYGLASTTGGYLASFLFKEHATAQMVVMAVSFSTGFLTAMVVYILSLLPATANVARTIRWYTRLIPSFSVAEGLINLAILDMMPMLGFSGEPLSMDCIGWPCLYMAAESPLFLFCALLIDHPRRHVMRESLAYNDQVAFEVYSDEDSDVEDERERAHELMDSTGEESTVTVLNLRKVYANGKVAVRDLSFSVMLGEVFGFLGTNGAGKTTTISILCQEFLPTGGRASICGYDVVTEGNKALRLVGYCPQFDACLDLLTVKEHLQLYAGVRGIAPRRRDDVVVGLLQLCGLTEYRNTLAHELSGGNRRKLSVAMALVGGPRVVFLDEPSAGMDPVARRDMWNVIRIVSKNCSVVLTTHHLEEVEALAHRVAIMVNGSLRCIGDKTHLKQKYGKGYEMHIRVSSVGLRREVEEFVMREFPEATVNERKGLRLVYALPHSTSLGNVFRILEREKEYLCITDYSVSQTSIEQVFLRVSGEER